MKDLLKLFADTSNAKCVGFFSTYTSHFSNSLDTTSALQFSSDSVTEVGTDPTGEEFSPARVSPCRHQYESKVS